MCNRERKSLLKCRRKHILFYSYGFRTVRSLCFPLRFAWHGNILQTKAMRLAQNKRLISAATHDSMLEVFFSAFMELQWQFCIWYFLLFVFFCNANNLYMELIGFTFLSIVLASMCVYVLCVCVWDPGSGLCFHFGPAALPWCTLAWSTKSNKCFFCAPTKSENRFILFPVVLRNSFCSQI